MDYQPESFESEEDPPCSSSFLPSSSSPNPFPYPSPSFSYPPNDEIVNPYSSSPPFSFSSESFPVSCSTPIHFSEIPWLGGSTAESGTRRQRSFGKIGSSRERGRGKEIEKRSGEGGEREREKDGGGMRRLEFGAEPIRSKFIVTETKPLLLSPFIEEVPLGRVEKIGGVKKFLSFKKPFSFKKTTVGQQGEGGEREGDEGRGRLGFRQIRKRGNIFFHKNSWQQEVDEPETQQDETLLETDDVNLDAYLTLLSAKVVNLDALRALTIRSIIPMSLRHIVWLLLLRVLPCEKADWQKEIKRKRERYWELAKYWCDGVDWELEKDLQSIHVTKEMFQRRQIYLDAIRTFAVGYEKFFDQTYVRFMICRIAYVWEKEFPETKYFQGFSDVATPMIISMASHALGVTYGELQTMPQEVFKNSLWFEADIFHGMSAVISAMHHQFRVEAIDHCLPVRHLTDIIARELPKLRDHFDQNVIDPLHYSYRWLLLLLNREFSLAESIRHYDILFSCLSIPRLHLFICVGILSHFQKKLLQLNNFEGIIELLHVLPFNHSTLPDLSILYPISFPPPLLLHSNARSSLREKKMDFGKLRRRIGEGKEREVEGRAHRRPLSPPLSSHASVQKPQLFRSQSSSFSPSSSLVSPSCTFQHNILFLDNYASQTSKVGKRGEKREEKTEEKTERGWWRGKEALLFSSPPHYSIPDHLLGRAFGLVQREERVAKGGAMVVFGLICLWTEYIFLIILTLVSAFIVKYILSLHPSPFLSSPIPYRGKTRKQLVHAVESLEKEVGELKEENKRLKRLLQEARVQFKEVSGFSSCSILSSSFVVLPK